MPSSEYPNLEEYMRYENVNLLGLFYETWTQYPVINQFNVLTTPTESAKFPVLTKFPKAHYREENTGKPNEIATTIEKTFHKKFLDGSWLVDVKSVKSHPKGPSYALFHEASTHFAGMMITLEKTVLYGDSEATSGELKGSFDGLIKLATTERRIETVPNPIGEGKQPLYTAIFVDKSKIKLLGQDGGFEVGSIERELTNVFATDEEKKDTNWVYAQQIDAYLGMVCGSNQGIYVVKANMLTDNILRGILAEHFYAGNRPDLLIMSSMGQESLRLSRTAFSPTGSPAPEVDSISGIPIITTDAMVDESVIVP